jgi:DNA-binding GntR family transcriptional regulator
MVLMDKPLNLNAGITRRDTLTDQAEAVLRESLMSGGFRPGQIITIRAISALLGVSVTPAKDAMTRLIGERILAWGPRRSAVVPALTVQSIDEIYAIRLALEPTAAAAAMENFDEKGVAELRKIHGRLAAALSRQNYKNVLISNRNFHFEIYKRAELPMLLKMIEGMWLRLGPSLNLLYTSYPKQQLPERGGTGFHAEIIDAIEGRNSKALRAFMVEDIAMGRDRLESIVSLQQPEESPAGTTGEDGPSN